MAGTVTVTEERLINSAVKKVTFAWSSSAGGAADGTTTYTYNGAILAALFVPNTGATQPDNAYDVVVNDADGIDVLNGLGADRANNATEWVVSGLGYVVGDTLTIGVTNANGPGKTGSVSLFIGVSGMPANSYTDLANALYGASGIAAFPAAAAAANNVSLAEVLRYIQETQLGGVTGGTVAVQLANLGGRMVSKEITYDGSASYPAFTVTGLVATKVVGYITTPLTNHADTTSVGTATSAAGLVAATAGTAMQTANTAWVDNAPSKFEVFPAAWALIGNGEDIAIASTANITGGVVTLYCWYIPISSSAAVVAA